MPVVSTDKDIESLKLTFVTEFDAGVDKVWDVWANPRKLERWWGPPTWPATFHKYEFAPGGSALYYMTGPDGTKAHGWWKFDAINEPSRISLNDGFANEDGTPAPGDPGEISVSIEDVGGKTRMTVENRFVSSEQMQQMLEMGMQEGMGEALGQIDALLAE